MLDGSACPYRLRKAVYADRSGPVEPFRAHGEQGYRRATRQRSHQAAASKVRQMNLAQLRLAEAKAEIGRFIAARRSDVSIGAVRDMLPTNLREAVSDLTIQATLRECGWGALGGGVYRRNKPKPARPRYVKP
jgi:hypothetical protein